MKKAIFRPIKIGPVTSKNRIEVAPAAPFLTGHDGSVSREFFEYTCSLARSGAGVVTIGVTNVDPTPMLGGRTLCMSPMYISDLSDMAEGIKRYGALASIELVHSKYMLSPPEKVVNETTTEQVEDVINKFADAALLAKNAGFDMVLIHGGHGNVPSMFFSKKYNHRTDRFGGNFENRCNFGLELLKAVRERTGGKIAIEYRISAEEILPGMTTFDETVEYAKVIQDYIDMLHVSRGLLEENSLLPIINAPIYLPRGMNIPFAKKLKQELHIPVSVVGAMNLDLAEEAINNDDVDMAAMIRTIYADTDCVEKARLGKDEYIRPCIRCNTCISRTHSGFKTVRCAVNPVIGRETWFDTAHKAAKPKKVAIIGGGPSGLEAARTCSKRGHSVVLFERSNELGGKLILAAAAEFKREIRAYLDWSIRTVTEDKNIDIRMNTEAAHDIVAAERPDAVIIAAGADPIIPAFSALGTDKLVWVGDAEAGRVPVGQNVVVAGAGVTGMEFALAMTHEGKQVTLVDRLPESEIGMGGSAINLICLRELLAKAGVRFICNASIEDITEDGVVITTEEGKSVLGCDTAVLSLGFRADAGLEERFADTAPFVWKVGDALRGGNVWNAIATAFDRAMQI